MEERRHCGWLKETSGDAHTSVIWARKQAATTSCPISYITPESQGLIEQFHIWKLFGTRDVYLLPARVVEAIFILEKELKAESNNGQD